MATNVTPFLNVLSNDFVAAVIKERDVEQSLAGKYLYRTMMPVKDVPEDRMQWKIVKEQSPLAGVYSQDGRPVPAGEISAEMAYAEVARIMANRVLDETSVKTLAGINELAPLAIDSPMISGPYNRHRQIVAKSVLDCDNQIEAQLEYFCMQALQGHISWPPKDINGNRILTKSEPYWGKVTLEVDLPFPMAYKTSYSTLTGGGGVAWNDPNADIIGDLDVMRQIISDETGDDADTLTLVMSRNDMRFLLKNTAIIEALRNVNSGGTLSNPNEQAIRRNLGGLLDVEIYLYDQKWTYVNYNNSLVAETVQKVRYLPLGRTLILPGSGLRQVGIIGSSPAKGPNATWQSGKFTWFVETTNPPFTTEVGVGINAFPMNQRYDSHLVFDMY